MTTPNELTKYWTVKTELKSFDPLKDQHEYWEAVYLASDVEEKLQADKARFKRLEEALTLCAHTYDDCCKDTIEGCEHQEARRVLTT